MLDICSVRLTASQAWHAPCRTLGLASVEDASVSAHVESGSAQQSSTSIPDSMNQFWLKTHSPRE